MPEFPGGEGEKGNRTHTCCLMLRPLGRPLEAHPPSRHAGVARKASRVCLQGWGPRGATQGTLEGHSRHSPCWGWVGGNAKSHPSCASDKAICRSSQQTPSLRLPGPGPGFWDPWFGAARAVEQGSHGVGGRPLCLRPPPPCPGARVSLRGSRANVVQAPSWTAAPLGPGSAASHPPLPLLC